MEQALDTPLLAQVIQLAIAPVFLLTAIAGFLSVITHRLGRVIDRARALEATLTDDDAGNNAAAIAELAGLDRRMLYATNAVRLAVSSAFIICLVITLMFLSAVSPLHPDMIVPILFIVAMILLTASLFAFAIETRIAMRTLRVRAELLKNAPRPPGDINLNRFNPL